MVWGLNWLCLRLRLSSFITTRNAPKCWRRAIHGWTHHLFRFISFFLRHQFAAVQPLHTVKLHVFPHRFSWITVNTPTTFTLWRHSKGWYTYDNLVRVPRTSLSYEALVRVQDTRRRSVTIGSRVAWVTS